MDSPTYALDKTSSIYVQHPESKVLVLTEDRLRVRLMEFQRRRARRDGWIAPAGILPTLVATLVAADFKADMLLPKATWHAIFILASAGTAIWLVVAVAQFFMNKVDLENLILDLRQDVAKAKNADKK